MDLCWVGNDVLFMNKYPKGTRFRFKCKIFAFRIIVKILDRYYIKRNWVVADHLKHELDLRNPIMKIDYPRSSPDHLHLVKYKKIKHDGFNILYYWPQTDNLKKGNRKFHEWLYGYGIYAELTLRLTEYNINWIIVDGTKDMKEIYPIVDFYLRPNRHDGMPFMVKECIANDIPFYWSCKEPDIVDAYLSIKKAMNDRENI